MTRLELYTKLLCVERERDRARAENLKYRDKLLELAKCCAECHGTGLSTGYENIDPDDITKGCRQVTSECDECADIRSVLA